MKHDNLIRHKLASTFHAFSDKLKHVNGKKEFEDLKLALARAGKFKTFLRLLAISGFESVLMRYVQEQPLTLFVPNDDAFAQLSLRVKSQLFGKKLRQLLEYHMVVQRYPKAYFKKIGAGAKFGTVYGKDVVRRQSATGAVLVSSPETTDATKWSKIVNADIEPKSLLLLSVHGVNRVLLPPKVFRGGLLKV